jgi:hypothetical protein
MDVGVELMDSGEAESQVNLNGRSPDSGEECLTGENFYWNNGTMETSDIIEFSSDRVSHGRA